MLVYLTLRLSNYDMDRKVRSVFSCDVLENFKFHFEHLMCIYLYLNFYSK